MLGETVRHEGIGLFDTPPNRSDVRLAIVVVGLQLAAFPIILWFRNVPLPQVQAFMPIQDALTFVGEAIIGALLYAQATVFRSRALSVLASGYLVGTLLIVPHALTFPGAFSEHGLLGAGVSTAAWLATFWWWALPSSVIVYTLVNRIDGRRSEADRPNPRIGKGIFGAVVLAALATLLATAGHGFLPPLFTDGRTVAPTILLFNLISVALPVVALSLLLARLRSVLEMWLAVAIAGYVIEAVANSQLSERFTFGWYANNCSIILSNFVVMLALLAESTGMYARLALSMAAKERERESRLLSLNAMATALFREIGQPLAALKLNTSAGLSWLDRKEPDTRKAAESIRAAVDASKLTFELMKTVRARISRDSGPLGEVNLNELVRESLFLLQADLMSNEISVHVDLGYEMPPVLASRVQIREVLVNLLTNAIEAVAARPPGSRLVTIWSAVLESGQPTIEISDAGPGIPAKRMGQIFDPFVTTKPGGLGLGLTLSRTIVEGHGGRLWATRSSHGGATFHMILPRSDAAKAKAIPGLIEAS